MKNVSDRVKSVVVAIRARKDDDSEFHCVVAPSGIGGTLILAHDEGEAVALEDQLLEGFHCQSIVNDMFVSTMPHPGPGSYFQ